MESFDKLEFLIVRNRYEVEIPNIILKMVTLRQVYFKCVYFSESSRQQATKDDSFPTNNNLESISAIFISDERNLKILSCFLNLQRLKCVVPSSLGISFDQFKQLKVLKLGLHDEQKKKDDPCPNLINFNFPSSLRKLTLSHVSLSQEQKEIIGGSQYLEVLKLENVTFEGGQWKGSEDEFPQLKFLKLCDVRLEELDASSDDFPSLQRLVLQYCKYLKIPISFVNINTLEMIELYRCSQDVEVSAKKIQEEQEENGNEVLKFVIISKE